LQLTLDHTQRLNLHALMGAQRGTVDQVRLFWKLQDRIQLSDPEKQAANFRLQDVNGMQQAVWDLVPANGNLPPVDYEFSDDEIARIRRVFKEWPPGFVASDRRWLEPLLAQLERSQT
jgi:hypothetical protein